MKEKLPHSRKPSHRRVCGRFGISESNITGSKKKTHSIHTNVYSVMFGIRFIHLFLLLLFF